MTIRIYSTEYKAPLSHEILDPLVAGLPPGIAAKALRYRLWQDAYGCIFGKLLLTMALKEQGMTADLRQLLYTDYGRPFLPDAPDFNISHSDHRVACAVAGSGRVGIDLEAIRELDIKDFKDQFSPEEWRAINGAPVPLLTFYHFWTAKEALSKADGRGLNIPLASLEITPDKVIRLDGLALHLQTLTHFPGYACHTAAEDPINEVVVKELDIKELAISGLEKYRNSPT
jgi:4'-phosphopantetheinyl transferase